MMQWRTPTDSLRTTVIGVEVFSPGAPARSRLQERNPIILRTRAVGFFNTETIAGGQAGDFRFVESDTDPCVREVLRNRFPLHLESKKRMWPKDPPSLANIVFYDRFAGNVLEDDRG